MPEIRDSKASASNKSALVSRIVWIGERRTSIRLEPAFWDALEEVCAREGMTTHEVCTMVAARIGHYRLTGVIRVFLLSYGWSGECKPALKSVPVGRLPDIPTPEIR
ncbi:MAG: ribbon-helix-helix domain-containing protein [Alphaproteobacteria bacterium]|jgi:predicted DNA-binding ribbon-helix-helix protein|nr:ribbon-helix-helix domain-containing protein [Alphaproteobacteria bacterium]|tara:strand:- start:1372 stop:1692 length:321 start_codon:yes stop_codon:yes gene_type:complete